MKGLGTHLIAEFYDCDAAGIARAQSVEEVFLQAAELARVTVVKSCFHEFSPYGVSGVLVIAESHFTIHTWPEHGYAAVDIFTCGDFDASIALEHMRIAFDCGNISVTEMKRGILPGITDSGRVTGMIGKPAGKSNYKLA